MFTNKWKNVPADKFLREVARTDQSGYFDKWGEFKEPYKKDKILLGFRGEVDSTSKQPILDFDSPVFMSFKEKANSYPAGFILGFRGSGKTTLGMSIVNQLHRKFGFEIFGIDPKGGLWTHKYPNAKADVGILNRVGLPPRGLPISVFTPQFLAQRYTVGVDKYFALGSADFNEIKDTVKRKYLILCLLGLTENPGSSAKLTAILNTDANITLSKMIKAADSLNGMKGDIGKRWRSAVVFDQVLNMQLDNKIISDDPELSHNFINELIQGKIVITQCSLTFQENVNSVYVAFQISKLTNAMEMGILEKPTCLFMDECDRLAPSRGNPPSKDAVEMAYTKYRSYGVSPWMVVQDPSTIDETSFSQADYYIVPKTTYGSRVWDSLKKYSRDILNLTELYRPTDISMHPKEFALCDSEGIVQQDGEDARFFPLPSPSATAVDEIPGDLF